MFCGWVRRQCYPCTQQVIGKGEPGHRQPGSHWALFFGKPQYNGYWMAAIRKNGKFMDMQPLIPGSFTFRLEAPMVTIRRATNSSQSAAFQWSNPFTRIAMPAGKTNPMKAFALIESVFIDFPIPGTS